LEDDYYQAPSKQRYVKELAKVVSENDVKSDLSEIGSTQDFMSDPLIRPCLSYVQCS